MHCQDSFLKNPLGVRESLCCRSFRDTWCYTVPGMFGPLEEYGDAFASSRFSDSSHSDTIRVIAFAFCTLHYFMLSINRCVMEPSCVRANTIVFTPNWIIRSLRHLGLKGSFQKCTNAFWDTIAHHRPATYAPSI